MSLPVSVGEATLEVDVDVVAETRVEKVVGTELNVLANDAGAELGITEVGSTEVGAAVEGAAVDGPADN